MHAGLDLFVNETWGSLKLNYEDFFFLIKIIFNKKVIDYELLLTLLLMSHQYLLAPPSTVHLMISCLISDLHCPFTCDVFISREPHSYNSSFCLALFYEKFQQVPIHSYSTSQSFTICRCHHAFLLFHSHIYIM